MLTPRFEMADYRRGSFVYAKDRLLVPPEAGPGSPPDERPNGIPPDLGRRRSRRRSTVDIATGYAATHRGTILKTEREGTGGLIAFWILALLLVASAVFVITAEKPVYSVVGLLLNFVVLAIMYLTLSAEFLAVIQIIVYSGAISILFLFVIALLSSGVKPFDVGPDRLPKALVPASSA